MKKRPSIALGVPRTPFTTPMMAMMTISMSVKPTKNFPDVRLRI